MELRDNEASALGYFFNYYNYPRKSLRKIVIKKYDYKIIFYYKPKKKFKRYKDVYIKRKSWKYPVWGKLEMGAICYISGYVANWSNLNWDNGCRAFNNKLEKIIHRLLYKLKHSYRVCKRIDKKRKENTLKELFCD